MTDFGVKTNAFWHLHKLTASLSPVQLSLRRGGGGVEATHGFTQSSPIVPAKGGGVEATHGLTKSSPIVPANGGCGGVST